MDDVRIDAPARIDAADHAAVTRLIARATEADGVSPVSEPVLLHLRHGDYHGVQHLLAWRGAQLVGYGHLDNTDSVAGSTAEVVVDPEARERGIGRAIVVRFLDIEPGLRLWAHGRQAESDELARSLGFQRVRVLLQMRRSLLAPLPRVNLPDGVVLRAFRPGTDDATWVALNARAFADLPDQGNLTESDLRMRMLEPWFEPQGFLVAERLGQMVGFHWTKVHTSSPRHEHLGEVYAVAVDPEADLRGLGSALVVAGLAHLRTRGLTQVLLYVDASNERAIGLYERLGFTIWDSDVQYSALP